jgi:hypothetical protein
MTGGHRAPFETLSYRANEPIEELARRANQSGVTLYPVHAAGLDNSIEFTAIPGDMGFGGTPAEGPSSDRWASFQLLATETGGVASVGTNNFARVTSTLNEDLGTYYSLGYRSPQLTKGASMERNITVNTTRKGLTARARKTFSRRTNEDKGRDAVLAGLVDRAAPNDLGISISVGTPQRQRRNRLVPIEVSIPMDKLTLLPSGDLQIGGFTVLVAAEDGRQRTSGVVRKVVDVKIPQADLKKLAGTHFTYEVKLTMAADAHELSVGVVDRNSGISGFATSELKFAK